MRRARHYGFVAQAAVTPWLLVSVGSAPAGVLALEAGAVVADAPAAAIAPAPAGVPAAEAGAVVADAQVAPAPADGSVLGVPVVAPGPASIESQLSAGSVPASERPLPVAASKLTGCVADWRTDALSPWVWPATRLCRHCSLPCLYCG